MDDKKPDRAMFSVLRRQITDTFPLQPVPNIGLVMQLQMMITGTGVLHLKKPGKVGMK